MEAPMTICWACRWHRNTHPGGPAGPPSDASFYQLCTHPDVERPTTIDPVSGKIKRMLKNDLGKTVLTEEAHPYCCAINEGNCPHYEPKEPRP